MYFTHFKVAKSVFVAAPVMKPGENQFVYNA